MEPRARATQAGRVQPIASKPTGGTLKVLLIFIFPKALSSRVFAFLPKWTGWVVAAAHPTPRASLGEDLSQNKETSGEHSEDGAFTGFGTKRKSPIRTLRITHRKTFYMNWTQIHKSKTFIGLPREGPGWKGREGREGPGCDVGPAPILFDLYLQSTSKRWVPAELGVRPFL